MKKYNAFDFTNKELEELAKEYMSLKLKRGFHVLTRQFERKRELDSIEIVFEVSDRSQRKYTFRFYFAEYFMECFVQTERDNYPIRETSDESLEVMELFLYFYTQKFGVDYIRDFEDVQGKKEDERFANQKANAKNRQEFLVVLSEHENNLRQLADLSCRMRARINGKKV